jgi:hypothetical protein
MERGVGIAKLASPSRSGGLDVRYAGPDPNRPRREHAVALAAADAARVTGVHQTADGAWHVVPFADHWQAAKWFAEVTNGYHPKPGTFVVWFDKDSSSWPYPSNENSGPSLGSAVQR